METKRPRTGTGVLDLARVRALAGSGQARAIRLRCGLSCEEIGANIGVAAGTVAAWERGARRPRGAPAVAYYRLLRALEQEAS